jgi:ATP-dependent RNA helicase RhlE
MAPATRSRGVAPTLIHMTPTVTPPPLPISTNPLRFSDLLLTEPLQRALAEKNYTEPSPIQAQSIPHLLEGRDLIGIAQTGTGKTAAFALPILQRLAAHPGAPTPKRPRALILAPTRELAAQIGQSFADYGRYLKLSHLTVFGGVNISPQIRALARGVDILIATPGRLMDLEHQRCVSLDKVEVFVLDEADRMLDLGFVHEIKRIITKLPPKRQSLLFSATMPPAIQEIASSMVRQPVRVEVTPASTTVERIEQQICFVDQGEKRKALAHFIKAHPEGLVLVFVRMKHMANKLVEILAKEEILAEAIHGNKSQGARQRALENFRTGRRRVLVATDIAARGIDVKGISLVIQHDLPEEPEAYVHRIGRTARAGKDGKAISFCDRSERNLLRGIERVIRQPIPVLKGLPFESKGGQDHAPSHDDSSLGGRQHSRFGAPRSGSGFRPSGNRNARPANGAARSRFGRGGQDRY